MVLLVYHCVTPSWLCYFIVSCSWLIARGSKWTLAAWHSSLMWHLLSGFISGPTHTHTESHADIRRHTTHTWHDVHGQSITTEMHLRVGACNHVYTSTHTYRVHCDSHCVLLHAHMGHKIHNMSINYSLCFHCSLIGNLNFLLFCLFAVQTVCGVFDQVVRLTSSFLVSCWGCIRL